MALLFRTQAQYATGTNPVDLAVGDVNGGGIVDLVTVNSAANTISVVLGNGDGTFATVPINYTVGGTGPQALAFGDFNGDNKLDVVTADRTSGNVSLLLNDGSGAFPTSTQFNVGATPADIAVADLNHDGKPDVI